MNEGTRQTSLMVMTIDKECITDTSPIITFTTKDAESIEPHDDDPMVITVIITRFGLKKVLIDQGSSVNRMR